MTHVSQRLYDRYVSSGQVPAAQTSAEIFFRPRAQYCIDVIKRHIPPDRFVRIVDLGCGHGAFLYFLKCAGYSNIVGVDASAEQIDQAHRLGAIEAQEGDIQNVLEHTRSHSVDVVIMFDLLEHLSRDLLFAALDEVHRVLTPGGTCLVHVPNGEGLYGMRIRYGDLTHEQAFTPRSLRQIFRTIGFRHIQCFEDKPHVHGIKSAIRRLLWALGTLPHRILLMAETGETAFILSQNILAIAIKWKTDDRFGR